MPSKTICNWPSLPDRFPCEGMMSYLIIIGKQIKQKVNLMLSIKLVPYDFVICEVINKRKASSLLDNRLPYDSKFLYMHMQVVNSVVMNHVTIGDGCIIQGSVICSNVQLQERVVLKDCQVIIRHSFAQTLHTHKDAIGLIMLSYECL